MSACEHLMTCDFFHEKLADMPRTTGLLKDRYCTDHFAKCARYHVSAALGPSRVPNHLFPNQRDKAADILSRT